jgi:hypothetical protein
MRDGSPGTGGRSALPKFPRKAPKSRGVTILHVELPEVLGQRVRRIAAHNRCTVSKYVEDVLAAAVEVARNPVLPGLK